MGSTASDDPRTGLAQSSGGAQSASTGSRREPRNVQPTLSGSTTLATPKPSKRLSGSASAPVTSRSTQPIRVSAQSQVSARTPTAPRASVATGSQTQPEQRAPADALVTPSAKSVAIQPVPAAYRGPSVPVNVVSTMVSGVVGFFGLNSMAAADPSAPVDSPVTWAMLAWVRRQIGQPTAKDDNATPLARATVTSESVDEPAAATNFATMAAAAAANTPPTALPSQSAPNHTTGAVSGSINGADVDGNTLSYQLSGPPPTNGTVALNATTGTFSYTPTLAARLAAGSTTTADVDRFSVSVSDGQSVTPVTVSVPVLPAVISAPTSTTVGTLPIGMAVSATNTYVANAGSNTVSVVNRSTGQVTSIGVVGAPTAIALSPDGRRAYVAGNNAVSVIDTSTNTVTSTVTTNTGQSFGIAVSPNGQRVYLTGIGSNRVTVLDTTAANPRVVATVQVGTTPGGVTVSPDGSRVYVANWNSRSVSVIDTANNRLLRTIAVGANPFGVAVSPDGTRVYVTNYSSNTVSVLNPTATSPVVATVPVGPQPFGLALSPAPDASVLYVANGNDTVSAINTTTNTVVSTIPIDSAPETNWHAIAVSPDGRQVYVSDLADRSVRVLTINRANSAPIAGTPTVGTPNASTGAVSGALNVSDADGDSLTYSVPGQPASGTVTVTAAGTYTYTPTRAARDAASQTPGPDSATFTVNASDGQAGRTVSVTVPISPSAVSNPPPPVSNPPADSTAALQAMFDSLRPGDTLTLSPQTYRHSGVLRIRASGVTIEGNGATLQATNDATSAVQILGDNVTVRNLNLSAPLTGTRYESLDQHKLVVVGDGVTVSDVTVTGSAASGVFVYGASNFRLNRVTVRNSRADGIHMTNGANNGRVDNAVTQWTGDDGVAVVSYGGEPICHDIVIESPTVMGTTHGRGISVVGGQDISYRNITVSQSSAAGVYIAAEGNPYFTHSVNRVEVIGGTVTGANTSTSVVHGAVLVYGGNTGRSVSNVTISGLTIADTPRTAYRNVGIVLDTGTVSNIAFTNIALRNTSLIPLALSPRVPAGSYTASGWARNGVPITVL